MTTLKSVTTSAQPGSPGDGDSYYIPAGATGADWSGNTDQIGTYFSLFGGWQFSIADKAITYIVEDEPTASGDALMIYRGSGSWGFVGNSFGS